MFPGVQTAVLAILITTVSCFNNHQAKNHSEELGVVFKATALTLYMRRNTAYFSSIIFSLSNTLASLYLEAYANSCYQHFG